MGLMPLGALMILAVVFGPFIVCWYLALRLLSKRMVLPVGMTPSEIKAWCFAISVSGTLLACLLFIADTGPGLFQLNAGMIIVVAAASVATSLVNVRHAQEREREREKLSSLFGYVLVVGTLGVAAGFVADRMINGLYVDN